MSKFAVMLAHAYKEEKFPTSGQVVIEPKLDGVRVIVLAKFDGSITYHSRNGRELTMFKSLDEEIGYVQYALDARSWDSKGLMLDGEMVSATFNEMAGTVHRKNHSAKDAKFHCFHAMPLEHFYRGDDGTPQQERLELLDNARFTPLSRVEFSNPVPVHSHKDVLNTYNTHRDAGFEGSMVKDMSKPWVAKRSYAWLKLKDELSVDVPVVGVLEGEGKYKGTCGTLVIDYNGVDVPVSGMTDAQRHEFWAHPQAVIGRMVEVSYQQETCHGSLRHPRFKRFREDKE